MALWEFKAEYDPDAHVWWTSNDALGITTEAETVEALAARLEVMVPEMVEECGEFLSAVEREEPHDIHLIAHHEMQFRAAA